MAKAEGAATTAEQAAAFVEALKREREGYEARLANAKAGRKENLSEEQLADRVKQVDAEIKTHSAAAKPKKGDDSE